LCVRRTRLVTQAACEALLALLESKRPKEERAELLHVYAGMWQLHEAAGQACASEDEPQYTFLKRLAQALCVLGQLLCEHVHDPASVPPNVDLYVALATPFASRTDDRGMHTAGLHVSFHSMLTLALNAQLHPDHADADGARVARGPLDHAAVLDHAD
jgi:hypothetical protein